MIQNMSGRSKNGSKTAKPGLPLISIITVVYNGVKTIEQTIVSVLNQSYENIEYIIIDGASKDGTLDVIQKYDNQIDIWISEPDGGIYDGMNKGISYAKGELIGIINADDWYESEIISLIADCYKNNGKKVVIHGLLRNFKDEQFYSIKGNSINVLRYDMVQHPTCFIPKSIYEQYGTYDVKYKYSADYDLILRYVNLGIEFKFIEKIIANFRVGGGSTSNNAQKEKYLILKRHGLISGVESMLRIVLLYCTGFIKKFLATRGKDKTVSVSF
jgi:glycosyltransferase involved in cell wall biosynthesis